MAMVWIFLGSLEMMPLPVAGGAASGGALACAAGIPATGGAIFIATGFSSRDTSFSS